MTDFSCNFCSVYGNYLISRGYHYCPECELLYCGDCKAKAQYHMVAIHNHKKVKKKCKYCKTEIADRYFMCYNCSKLR